MFAWLWIKLAKSRLEPSTAAKFAIGLVFVGLGFAVLIGPARDRRDRGAGQLIWLTLTYFLHTIGELSLSPVGLSAMTKLAPARIAGLTMGVWFLATSVGNYIGGRVAGLYESIRAAVDFHGRRDVRNRRRLHPLRVRQADATNARRGSLERTANGEPRESGERRAENDCDMVLENTSRSGTSARRRSPRVT